jgi:hypothetical protein
MIKFFKSIYTTNNGTEINRNAIFGTIYFIAGFVYLFVIKPGDITGFAVIEGFAAVNLGLSIPEDKTGSGSAQ